ALAVTGPRRGDLGARRQYRPAIHGPEFDHVVGPGKPVSGTVRDRATGRPVTGVTVVGAPVVLLTEAEVRAVTDADGRYRLVGLPKEAQQQVVALPPAGSEYLRAGRTVNDTEGLAPLTADLELVRGITVEGRLTDRATGRPMAGKVTHWPMPDNTHLGLLGS